jgi:ribose transport system substrate-binding protein
MNSLTNGWSIRRRLLNVVIPVVLVSALAACGSSDSDSDADADATSGGDESAIVEQAKRAVAKAEKGRFGELPSKSPRPEPGRDVWWISCGQASETCSTIAEDAKQAAESIGWNLKVFDSKTDPSLVAAGIRQAIAAKADAVIVMAFDCAPLKGPLLEAKRAGVKVEGVASRDCPGGLYDGTPQYEEYGGLIEYTKGVGELQGWLAIAATDGKAKVLNFARPDAAIYVAIREGLEEVIKKCGGCSIVDTVEISAADLAQSNVATKAGSALQANPDANAVTITSTGVAQAVMPAIVQSGHDDDIFSVSLGQEKVLVDAVRNGRGLDAGVSTLNSWQAWAAIDDLVRIFAGEPRVNAGIGLQVWMEKQLESDMTQFDTREVDYRANYRRIWGAEE